MDNHRTSTARRTPGTWPLLRIGAFGVALGIAFIAGPQVQAQQPKLTARYAKAALTALQTIESDTSAPHDRNSEAGAMSVADTLEKLEVAGQTAATKEDGSNISLLRQIYQLRLQDNNLMRAYSRLMDVDGTQDANDDFLTRRRKDSSLSQFADDEDAIMKREEACFRQLEQDIQQRSPETAPACSDWILKGKASNRGAARSAVVEEFHAPTP
jgi:hypothetical protein